jgi:chromosomal replication initiator protein
MLETTFWEQIKSQLLHHLSGEAWHNWVSRTEFLGLSDEELRVGVPDEITRMWMEGEYAAKVAAAIRELRLPVAKIHYELMSPSTQAHNSAARRQPSPLPPSHTLQLRSAAQELNPRLTFDTFVVGSCNQFAHAAARAVAERPSRSYNPLFIYGGSGMGKTHLIHAIGTSILSQYPRMRLVYTTGEQFVNDMVNCIRTDRMVSFHQHYRTADVLLIDDVHALAGKERTQEEFFHTFNDLFDHQKQIALTSDSLPKHMNGLVERLRTRFEWGLMVDVQPPDLETKMAILDHKAQAEGITLPEDVRIFLATKTKSSVRELEGAWTKLLACSSMTGSPITLGMAQQALKPILSTNERRLTIDSVTRAVADRFSLQPSQIKQKTNAHEISRPRQVAMYLAKELTGASLQEIGRAFGGKHHTTVLHSIRKIEELRREDPDLNKTIHSIIDSFS